MGVPPSPSSGSSGPESPSKLPSRPHRVPSPDLVSRPTRTLGDRRRLFSRLLAELVIWIEDELKVRVAFDEVTVHSPRAARLGLQRGLVVEDAVHKRGSFHHQGLAADLLIYADLDGDGEKDDYLSNGGHPIWRKIAEKWESMHPLATSGIRFQDANHVSLGEGARPSPFKA